LALRTSEGEGYQIDQGRRREIEKGRDTYMSVKPPAGNLRKKRD